MFSQLIRRMWIDLGYRQWKRAGGLYDALGVKNDDEVWERIAEGTPKYLSIQDPVDCTIDVQTIASDSEGLRLIVAQEQFVMRRANESQQPEEVSPNSFPLQVEVVQVFPVPLRQMHFGCCSRFPILKSIYVGQKFGGDPACGGGLKRYFPPLRTLMREHKKLRNALKGPRLDCFVQDAGNNTCGVVYEQDGNRLGFMRCYLGDEAAVREYLEHNTEKSSHLKRISISW